MFVMTTQLVVNDLTSSVGVSIRSYLHMEKRRLVC